ncbi:MAG: threonine--tRNA ligase [Bacillota bacterium]|jgi:threonyl-tRNA synthetase|nr:threonine--tRNA ligase [Bacillota bacterium]HOL52369.1 threonine--tRNA ligase [Bacillota bacterium]HPQ02803.1 threonine--tRNA ligase [Bacillota bacterium]HPZ14686.1 threonine--tRNA ligase [Bacillota bacterium]HQD79424.1 threonine--tRNA ligase [Bacillota bacterium]
MENVKVTLPDGAVIELPSGTTVGELASRIGRRLAAKAVVGLVDGVAVDLSFPISEDCHVTILDATSPEGLNTMRHSAAHVMAQAVKRLFPGVKLAIGPTIDDGFYYDFDIDHAFTSEDLEKIEAEMAKIIAEDLPIVRQEVSWVEAMDVLKSGDEVYKMELLNELGDGEVSFYRQGEFCDMCRGPHLPRTGMIGAFKLLSVAGAYWRGDENRPMLSRIYGTAFPTRKELDEHLRLLEEAAKRDHRKLGKELDIFSVHEEAGAGLIFYHPHGAAIRHSIEDFWMREHIARGYKPVITPHIAESTLWTISGHNDYYRENMYYLSIDEKEYVLKPMNCPGHILIYKTATRSYRDMPIRYCELGTVYRYERSGALHGLLRVRGFTQDDAHIFCTPEQLRDEIVGVIDLTQFMLKSFGFSEYEFFLSTRPEKSVGSDENWERATAALRDALEGHGLKYTVDPGEGVFYGPKIDTKLKDSLGRLWQGPTIQVDFNLPERFDVNYIGEDGEKHRAIMIHRTVLGSMERFMGCLIEQYAGALPVWLSPVQARVLSIGDRHIDYAMGIARNLSERGFRVDTDVRDEKIGYKIREAQLEKTPYMLIVGDREMESGQVAVRARRGGDLGAMTLNQFADRLRAEVDSRTCEDV